MLLLTLLVISEVFYLKKPLLFVVVFTGLKKGEESQHYMESDFLIISLLPLL